MHTWCLCQYEKHEMINAQKIQNEFRVEQNKALHHMPPGSSLHAVIRLEDC